MSGLLLGAERHFFLLFNTTLGLYKGAFLGSAVRYKEPHAGPGSPAVAGTPAALSPLLTEWL